MRTLLVVTMLLATTLLVSAAIAADGCLACHQNVGAGKLAASVHGSLACTDCHAGVVKTPHAIPTPAVDCGACHAEAVAAWAGSLHAMPGRRGARCVDCHGAAHEVLSSSDRRSPAYRTAIPRTCGRCHAQKFIMEAAGLTAQPAIAYQDSVHGRAAQRGATKAAVCTDCHDFHAVRPGNDPQSAIFKFNVGRTCGKCHAAIATQYADGIHGKALARGNWGAPVCTDCHGIHTIARTSDVGRGPRATCQHCHESVRLNDEYAMPVNRVSSYASSYHGLARRMGSKKAADCASCHGAHRILPSTDPRSPIHSSNLAATCGKCHPGAAAQFGRGKVHFVAGGTDDLPALLNTWIRRLYILAIGGAAAFMLTHNLLLWWRKASARRRARRTVVRMNRNQRVQHLIMLVTFVILALSGFALLWPESWLAAMFGPNEEVRRWIHRLAAVIMMLFGVYHLGYMILTAEGRKGLHDFRMRLADVRDIARMFRYSLGLSAEKPRFGRFSYGEKIEYWAGMWGTLLMSATGLVIWFAVIVTRWIPRWWIDIAITVHLFEAILATMSIVIWHLYHVIFDPDVYPMNWAWLDGRMSEEHYREEHGLDVAEPKEDAR